MDHDRPLLLFGKQLCNDCVFPDYSLLSALSLVNKFLMDP